MGLWGIYSSSTVWGRPENGGTQNGWFIRENPIEMDDDWRYPYFRKPPYHDISDISTIGWFLLAKIHNLAASGCETDGFGRGISWQKTSPKIGKVPARDWALGRHVWEVNWWDKNGQSYHHWIGSREHRHRKPRCFYHSIWVCPVNFPANQCYHSVGCRMLSSLLSIQWSDDKSPMYPPGYPHYSRRKW